MVQATKSKEKSCSFLDAIGGLSCGPPNELAKHRNVGKPGLRLKRIETARRYATVNFVTILILALQLRFEPCLSFLLCMHIIGHATESEVHTAVSFFSISLLPPPPTPLSLSLSLSSCDQCREKESLPLNTTIRTSKRKFAKCGLRVSGGSTDSMEWLIQTCNALGCCSSSGLDLRLC